MADRCRAEEAGHLYDNPPLLGRRQRGRSYPLGDRRIHGQRPPLGTVVLQQAAPARLSRWLKEVLSPPNPYTGIPLAKDPAVGVFILQNEDSLLWWSTQAIKPQQKAVLAACFADWLKSRYGSLQEALKTWDGDTLKDDRLAEGVVGLYDLYAMTVPQAGGKGKRIADQYRFLVETMRRFNAETAAYLRSELGCKARRLRRQLADRSR